MSQHRNRNKQTAKGKPIKVIWILIGIAAIVALVQAAYLVWSAVGGGGSDTATSQVTPEVNGAPRLKADRETIDLGKVQLGKNAQAVFELANVGDQPLRFAETPYIEVVEGC